MKTGRAAMWANWRAFGAALVALGLTAGCGKTGTTESGETHFVSCNTDTDCTDVTDAHTCSGGFCRGPANDGSAPSSKPPACEGGCATECATPGTCTLVSACELAGCGSASVDDNACVRPTCTDDNGCPDDERCTAVWLSGHSNCVQNGASCDCNVALGLYPVNVCSPVTLAGARGGWQKLVVTEAVLGDSTIRTFYPDGSVTIEQHSLETDQIVPPSTAQLSPADLDELTRQIRGPFLRPELAEPEACPTTIAPCPSPGCRDYMVDLYLNDSTGNGSAGSLPTLSKNVTGCLSSPNEVVAFGNLIDLVSRY